MALCVKYKRQNLAEIALNFGADINKEFANIILSKDSSFIAYAISKNADPQLGLLPAIEINDPRLIKQFIQMGAKVNDPNMMKKAVLNANEEIVVLLMANGAIAEDGIKEAIQICNYNIAQVLLKNGAKAEAPQLIEKASSACHTELIQLLLSAGAKAQDGLFASVRSRKVDNLKLLLQSGANPSDKKFIEEGVKSGQLTIVQELINYGSNPEDGIALSIRKNNIEIASYLIEMGANASNGEYLKTSILNNSLKMVELLISKGCNLQYKDEKQNTLLHFAAKKGNKAINRKLIQTGQIDINAKNDIGDAAIHFVVDNRKQLELCQIYVESGADVNSKNSEGKRVYKVAKGVKMKKYLKSKGAKKK